MAYLCTTVATEFRIDRGELAKMVAVFHADSADDDRLPICVVVCPDLESCQALQLETDAASRVRVGYTINRYGEYSNRPA